MCVPVPRWPVERPLGMLLQTPAHRVLRVLRVTQAQWREADVWAVPLPQPDAVRVEPEPALSA